MKPDLSRQDHVYEYRIDEHGSWLCEGNPVEDPELFRLLSRSLFCAEGAYYLRCEGEVHPVQVADAPLWVRAVHPRLDEDGCPEGFDIELRDGRRESLDPRTLQVVNDRAIYCRVTKRNLKARFAKLAYYELARYLETDEDGRYRLLFKGASHILPSS